MSKRETINKYLELLHANPNVINYINDNNIPVYLKFEQILGKNFDFYKGSIIEQQNIEKLKNSQIFKVLDDGSVWLCDKHKKVQEKNLGNFNIKAQKNKYDEENYYQHISFQNEKIFDRYVIESKYTNEDQILFDGKINEKILDFNANQQLFKQAIWLEKSTLGIPDYELSTNVWQSEYSGAFEFYKGKENIIYNDSIWDMVMYGDKNPSIVENYIMPKKVSMPKKFKLIKESILGTKHTKNQYIYYHELGQKYLELIKSTNPDEIIHSNFTIGGKLNDKCRWCLERITEISRESIFELDFNYNEEFKKSVIEPSILDFAEANEILKESIISTQEQSLQYRNISTTNNVLTINNISEEYANYISQEIKKVEPSIYQKQMAEIEKQTEKENDYGYQKQYKKSGGFVDIILLSSIVGFVAGFLLFIMCIILKYNLF